MTQQNLDQDGILPYVQAKVTDERNASLCRPFTEEGVEKSLFTMGPNKAPGPDGYTAGFFFRPTGI